MKRTLILIILSCLAVPAFAAGFQGLQYVNVPSEARVYPIGRMDPHKHLYLVIELPIRNKAQHDQFLHDLYDPKSPDYRHYLTPEEYAQRFGPSQSNYTEAADFFKNQGFKVMTSSNRAVLDIDGTVRMVESTFHTTLRLYRHPSENRSFYAPDQNPSVDLGIPFHVSGLDNFLKLHPR